MKFYIQINEDGYITDAINYEYEKYIECQLQIPLPDKFIAGCYKYLGNNLVERDEERYKQLIQEESE